MSNVPSIQPPQNFLEIIGRLYKKRDGIKSNNYGYPGNYNPNTGQISK